jgi:hypothetical protein
MNYSLINKNKQPLNKKKFTLFCKAKRVPGVYAIKNLSLNEVIFDYLKNNKFKNKKKENLYSIGFAGDFYYRSEECLIKASGYAILDFDKIKSKDKLTEIWDYLINWGYCVLLFISPSGKGIKALVKIPTVNSDQEYKEYYEAIQDHFNKIGYGLWFDKSTKNIARATYLPNSERVYHNITDVKIWEKKKKIDISENEIDLNSDLNVKDVKEALSYIPSDDYEIWFPVLCAIKNHKLSINIADAWSKNSEKYKGFDNVKKQWDKIDTNKNHKVTFGTVIYWAREFGWKGKINQKNKKSKEQQSDPRSLYAQCFPDGEDPETEINILKHKPTINFLPLINELDIFTNHLPLFAELNIELGLKGTKDKVFEKHIWYRSNSLMQPTTRTEINSNTSSDNRVHDLIIGGPNAGKGLKKNYEKKLCQKNSIQNYEISALSHREQLIGKTVNYGTKKNPQIKQIKGILSSKSLQQDEAQNIINETDGQHGEAMRIMRQAMDVFGENEISKKLIEDEFDNALKYYPKARITQLIHPSIFGSQFFATGTFRRYNAIIDLNSKDEIDILDITNISIEEENTKNELFSDLVGELYKDKKTNLSYTKECLGILSEFNAIMLKFLLESKHDDLIRYAMMTKFSLKILIMKYINILHLAYNESLTNPKLTICACLDFLHVWLHSLEAIVKFGNITLADSSAWFGCEPEEKNALEYLFRKGAFSKSESSVSIKKFQTVLGELFGVRVTQSRSKMHSLENKGIIESKQIGRTETKFWLKRIPEELKLINSNFPIKNIAKFLNFKGAGPFNIESLPLNYNVEQYRVYSLGLGEDDEGNNDSATYNTFKDTYTRNFTNIIYNILYNLNVTYNTSLSLSPIVKNSINELKPTNNKFKDDDNSIKTTDTIIEEYIYDDSVNDLISFIKKHTQENNGDLIFDDGFSKSIVDEALKKGLIMESKPNTFKVME